MQTTELATLDIPPNARSMQLVKAFARSIAEAAGFQTPESLNAIELAAEESFGLVLARAVSGADSAVQLRAFEGPLALELAFDDQELPPLPPGEEMAPVSIADSLDAEQLSRTLIRHAADEAHWIPLGRDGNRLRLVFKRPREAITETLDAAHLAQFDESADLAPAQTYDVRHAGMAADDWAQIARAMYRAYGFTYAADDFYVPERIEAMNRSGRVASIVAVAEDGEVVGHYALDHARFMSSEANAGRTAELGKAVVDPRHRGRGLMEQMRALAEQTALEAGLKGVFSEPVTMHPYSQRANLRLGAVPTALNLGMVGNSISLKAMGEEDWVGRQSTFIFYKPLDASAPRVVHAPDRHVAIIGDTLTALGLTFELATTVDETSLPDLTELEVHYIAAVDIGLIAVHRVGNDCIAPLKFARDDLVRRVGTRVIYLDVPMADPGCPHLVEAAESLGFFYSGIGPDFADTGDVLRMQYVDTLVAVSQHAVVEGAAQTLFDYVIAERARIDRGV